jgi:hypothetical protein
MRLLVLQEPDHVHGVTWWRLYSPLVRLSRVFPDIQIEYNQGHLRPDQIMGADVVFALRPHLASMYHVLLQAKNMGCKIVLDYDDDLTSVTMSHPNYFMYRDQKPRGYTVDDRQPDQVQAVIRGCLNLADLVWVSTEPLVGVYGHRNTYVVPNAVMPHDLPDEPAPSGTQLRVVWRGSGGHIGDLYGQEEIFNEMVRRKAHFFWLGYMPPMAEVSGYERQSLFPLMDAIQYFMALQRIAPNIVWKPLRDIPMNRAKSNIAWLEATIAGGVCVGGFPDIPLWEHCVSVSNMFDKRVRDAAWEQSRAAICRHYNLDVVNLTRYQTLHALLRAGV